MAARPLVEHRLDCAEVPWRTYPRLLLPLLRLGKGNEARRLANKGYPRISRNPKFLDEISYLALFRAIEGRPQAAVRLVAQHVAWAEHSIAPSFELHLNVGLAFECLAGHGEAEPVDIDFPSVLGLPEGPAPAAELAAAFAQRTGELAAAFDRRNGNRAVGRRAERRRALVRELMDRRS